MKDWIQILVAFVNNDESYEYGTNTVQEMKVATPQGRIEIRMDERWNELTKIGEILSGDKP